MKTTKKSVIVAILCIVLVLMSAISVSADMGPKPSVSITLENAPQRYYLDLLVDYDGSYHNLYSSEIETLDEKMLESLQNFSENGWYPALAHGTSVPLFGTIVPDENNLSHFSYFGVPNKFRVIVVDGECNIKTSGVIEKKYYQEHITLDYNSMIPTGAEQTDGGFIQQVRRDSPAKSFVLQFLSTCIPTLLIEIAIFLLFRMSFKKHWYKLLIVNFITQIGVNFALSSLFLNSGWFSLDFIFYVFVEICVLIVEVTAYIIVLRGEKKWKRIVYPIAANITSGFVLAFFVELLYKMFWVK